MDDDIRSLLDHQQINDLVHRLGASLDEGRFDNLRTLLTRDATAETPGGRAEGIDAVVAQASRNHQTDKRVQHVITGILVDLDGDRATVRANVAATFVSGGEVNGPRVTLGGTYRFGAARTPAGWRLTRVASTPVWVDGDLGVLGGAVPTGASTG